MMRTFTNDGLTFDVLDEGPGRSGTIVLLHGFPQTNQAWMDVAPHLHAAGFRTLAPALRGYCDGAMPAGRRPYRIECLVRDVVALLDAAGLEHAHLVGHDWGGAVAWQTAMQFAERVERLTVFSTPHPGALRRAAFTSLQGLRSWYMAAMAVPRLPEALLTRGVRRGALRRLGLPQSHAQAYRERILKEGAMRAMIGPYRALFVRPPRDAFDFDVEVTTPTTYVWPRGDAYLGRRAAELTEDFCTGPYRFVELDGDHWLPEKQSVRVAQEILRHP